VKRSTLVFVLVAVIAAAGCIRLGFWQLDRLGQRRAMNARIASRISAPAVDVMRVERDTTRSRFSIVTVSGTPDFEHETLLTLRGHDGSPGVDILTPVRLAGSDTAVIVNRGWVYSPDGMTIERARWRETDTVFTGYVDAFEVAPGDSIRRGGIRHASHDAIARSLPYPILPFYVVALADSASPAVASTPRIIRLDRPKLGEGPHMSYALQWFGFALVSLIGAGIIAARSMHSGKV
jgi:surfeit locus 1 family protein